MSLRKNLVVAFVLFALGLLTVTLVPFGVVSVHGHLRSFIDAESVDNQRTASAVARSQDVSRALTEHYEGQADAGWLLDASGSTMSAPTNRQAFPALVTRAPEVESARRGTTNSRIADTPIGRRLLIASPTFTNGRLSGVLWASVSLAPVLREDRETWAQLAAIGAVVMVIAALVGVFLSRRIARRLEIVAAGAKRFGEGHLGETILVGGSDEITALAATLNTMGAEIDRLVHREKDFVAAASHQIRTPLTAIKIRIDELLSTTGTHDAEETEYLKEMAEEVDRLTMLTTRLLDLSSAEVKHDARPLPAAYAVREAIDRIEPLAHHFGISVDLDVQSEDSQIMAAPGAFEEALFNVLDNAVKYSPPGEGVQVSALREDGSFVVRVSDHGPGIATEQRARVLEPFYRATRTKSGYGLGLAISARLCTSAGATLDLDTRRGGGTTATIRWPAEH
ncbi:MAG TPA: HAMP domain-containing sensor histidine kinase [Actinomycetota bacterium]|nr:HAMP domain-containing sensor histidine kinase [Actinomycetota bacterium]